MDGRLWLEGSIGMLPSAAVGTEGPGLYEPVHGGVRVHVSTRTRVIRTRATRTRVTRSFARSTGIEEALN